MNGRHVHGLHMKGRSPGHKPSLPFLGALCLSSTMDPWYLQPQVWSSGSEQQKASLSDCRHAFTSHCPVIEVDLPGFGDSWVKK
mmetsp:Transcript_91321/g.158316  ORF Transcript_91321/g.158316 Transcript_91321/m.158316 type:complete len:84 (+) Transcript_91321:684-935(+)